MDRLVVGSRRPEPGIASSRPRYRIICCAQKLGTVRCTIRNHCVRGPAQSTRNVSRVTRSSSLGAPYPSGEPRDGTLEQQDDHMKDEDEDAKSLDEQLRPYHYVAFLVVLCGGLLFVSMLLYLTGDIEFQRAVFKSISRLMRTVAIRQLGTIVSAIVFIKYGLEPAIKLVRKLTKADGAWEKSPEYYVLREVYKPLEFLFIVAAMTTLAENMLPQVINIPKSIVQTLVRSTNCLTFVVAAARVVFNIKGRIVRENSWQLELKGDLTRQRRLEAIDKLMSLATLVIASFFGVRALGMDVNSVLAIGGVGGVALGLAGREILENLFTGLIILTSNPFEVGDEVLFRPSSGQVVEGIVLDVGWYRTTIRSFEREIYTIPNSVFTRNVVLNITRKNREWRFYEFLYLRIEDLPKVTDIVSDARKILRQDNRIIQKLHRRVFLDNVTKEHCKIYISFYVEAANRDAFMAVKQDLLLAFIDCVERNGAHLARNRLQLEMLQSIVPETDSLPVVDIPTLPQVVDITEQNGNGDNGDPSSPMAGGERKNSEDETATVHMTRVQEEKNKSTKKPTPSQQQPSPDIIAKAMSSSETASNAVRSSISPDPSIISGTQQGPTIMGSYDDDLNCLG